MTKEESNRLKNFIVAHPDAILVLPTSQYKRMKKRIGSSGGTTMHGLRVSSNPWIEQPMLVDGTTILKINLMLE